MKNRQLFPRPPKLALVGVLFFLLQGAASAQFPPPLACEAEALAAIDLTQATLGGIPLPPATKSALQLTLDIAEFSADNGFRAVAALWMSVFQNQVQALQSAGLLDAVDASALLQTSSDAILILQNCSSTPRVRFFNVRAGEAENRLFWVNPTANYQSTRILFRTDRFPTGPSDPLATSLGDFVGIAGARDTVVHSGLMNGTTFFYSAFVNNGAGRFSAPKRSFGRPDDTTGTFKWAYTVGGPLPIAGVIPGDDYFATATDALHATEFGDAGGAWPAGWQPVPILAPSNTRPTVLSVSLNGASERFALVSTRTGQVRKIDIDTGAELWPNPPVLGTAVDASASVSISAGLVVVGSRQDNGDSKLYGLKLSDGQVAWAFDNGGGPNGIGPIRGQPAIFFGRVYFTSEQKPGGTSETVWCLSFDASSATKVWSASIGDVKASPSLSRDNPALPVSLANTTIYAANTTGEIHAFNADTGTVKWAVPYPTADGPVRGFVNAEFLTNRMVFASDSQVQGMVDNGAAGAFQWAVPVANPSTVGGVGVMYSGSGDGQLYRFDVGTGAFASVALGDPATTKRLGPPTIDVTGTILTGSDEGVLYAVDPF